ncbi:MAG: divalent-cation tolerance protein CutA [Campylobacterales bacterium]|nr:divalent-cation tolerance protein CutA [Campylobacterales bacterium]
MKKRDYILISTTTNDKQTAQKITSVLLEHHLVACVQSHNITSQYYWDNALVNDEEIVLNMKCRLDDIEKIQKAIEDLHNYEVPQIIVTPILTANQKYLEWLEKQLR